MAQLIRTSTKDGAELVEYALSVFRDVEMSDANRQWALQWLSDRGFGKAPLVLDVSFNDQDDSGIDREATDLEEMTEEQVAALAVLDAVRGTTPSATEH